MQNYTTMIGDWLAAKTLSKSGSVPVKAGEANEIGDIIYGFKQVPWATFIAEASRYSIMPMLGIIEGIIQAYDAQHVGKYYLVMAIRGPDEYYYVRCDVISVRFAGRVVATADGVVVLNPTSMITTLDLMSHPSLIELSAPNMVELAVAALNAI